MTQITKIVPYAFLFSSAPSLLNTAELQFHNNMKCLVFLILFSFISHAHAIRFVTENFPPYQVVDDKNNLIAGTSNGLVNELINRANVQMKQSGRAAEFIHQQEAIVYKYH